MKKEEIVHLYNRAGFGISPSLLKELKGKSRKKVVDTLFNSSSTPNELIVDVTGIEDAYQAIKNTKDAEEKQKVYKKSWVKVKEFNVSWIEHLSNTNSVLREKMTLFWNNHFVTQTRNILYLLQYNNMLRTHALGNFRDLVISVSKGAAMIEYLNLNASNKDQPNENFARELLELFTLGRDTLYNENDIHEASKAFTGYRSQINGDFLFRENQHDGSEKTFMGEKGPFIGDDIINIVLNHRESARFICSKIYKNFVNEEVHKGHLEEMTTVFHSNYDLTELMRSVFMSDWFYEEVNVGAIIKSPTELLVGIKRTVPIVFEKQDDYVHLQRLIGQQLLEPPNVAGYPGGRGWINPNVLMIRMNLASYILNANSLEIEDKGQAEDSYDEIEAKAKESKSRYFGKPDWDGFDKEFKGYTSTDILSVMITGKANRDNLQKLTARTNISLRALGLLLMSVPEYQLS